MIAPEKKAVKDQPEIQNAFNDPAKVPGAEIQIHESVAEPVQVNVAHPGASLAAPAMAETIVPGGAGADSSPSIESGDAIPLPESSSQAGATTQQSEDEIVEELASLEPLEYDKVRLEKAKSLGIRLPTLDAAVRAKQIAARADQSETGSLPFAEVEPHPESIIPAQLLNEMVDVIRQLIVLGTEQAHAVVLWIASTWFIEVVEYAPLLIINSPEKSCAKTKLLDVIGRMCFRSLSASNASPSSLFRAVDLWKPTILIDEADTFFRGKPELAGMVNAGYQPGGKVLRSVAVGGSFEPQSFSVFCAKAIAGIDLKDHLPDATISRSIWVDLIRKLPHELVTRLRHKDVEAFEIISAKLARLAEDYAEQVRQALPDLPEELSDRDQDNWEPLLAIAMLAGDVWLARGIAAALKLSGAGEKKVSTGNELLADIRQVFVSKKLEWSSTGDLITALCDDDEKSWATFNRGNPISAKQIASQLVGYGIKSQQKRFKRYPNPVRGYELSQFSDAFERYLPPDQKLPLHPLPTPEAIKHGVVEVTDPANSTSVHPPSVTPEATPLLGRNTVTDKTAPQVRPDESGTRFDHRTNPMLPNSLRMI